LRVWYSVVDVGHGDCQASNLSNDPESLRCFASDQVFDPCWASLDAVTAVCLRDPWDRDVITLTIDNLDQGSNDETNELPWALELAIDPAAADAVRCVFVGGAGATVAGQRVNWHCEQGGTDAGDVIGDPAVSTDRPWRVFYSSPSTAEVVEVEVRTVWR
jgi:hypothetical protein